MHAIRRGPVAALLTSLLLLLSFLVVVATPAAAVNTTIKINEVESNGGTPGDWVELVNTGTDPVDVSGWVVKDSDDTHSFVIPAATTMAGGGFLALDVEVAYGLGAADSARLFEADGTTLVDSYSWTAHAGTTYGRCPDGTGAFKTTTSSTKGLPNDCSTPVVTSVKINEVESNGGTPGDWIELVNTGASADISGYILKDSDDSHSFVIPAGTTIGANAYLALDVETSYGLGAADSARLFAPNGTTLLDTTAGTAHAAVTYGRCPDGVGSFVDTTASTKGAANACSVASGPDVKINEIESNGGTPGDWIELINNGATAADISGWVVKDNDDTHVSTIPASTTVAAGGYYIVEEAALGFGLGTPDSARLFLPGGTTLVDSYSWTPHATTTYGRCPNGTGAFVTTTSSTKAAPNDCKHSGQDQRS